MPVYLAAQAHGARQLSALCMHWMAKGLGKEAEHEQWGELSEATRAEVRAASAKLEEAARKRAADREMRRNMPCRFAPIL